MHPLKRSTAHTQPVFAFDSSGDAVTGLLTGDWTKRISKNSGAFGAMTVTITEKEGGWYDVIMDSGHTDTAGILTCYFTHSLCKQVNIQYRVHVRLPDDMAYPTTTGRPIDVNTAGHVGLDFDETSGTLAKDTDITGFNDLPSTAIAAAIAEQSPSLALAAYDGPTKAEVDALAASLALTAYDPPTKAEVDTSVQTTVREHSASLALAAYDGPTKAEMDAGHAALNDPSVAEIWAVVIEGAVAADAVLQRMNSYMSGVVVKQSTEFTYYNLASTALWTNNINAAWRRPG